MIGVRLMIGAEFSQLIVFLYLFVCLLFLLFELFVAYKILNCLEIVSILNCFAQHSL